MTSLRMIVLCKLTCYLIMDFIIVLVLACVLLSDTTNF